MKKKQRVVHCLNIGERPSVIELLDELAQKLENELEPHLRKGWPRSYVSWHGLFRGQRYHFPGSGIKHDQKFPNCYHWQPEALAVLQGIYALKHAYLKGDVDSVCEEAWNVSARIRSLHTLKESGTPEWLVVAGHYNHKQEMAEWETEARKARSKKAAKRRGWIVAKYDELMICGRKREQLSAQISAAFREEFGRPFSAKRIEEILAEERPIRLSRKKIAPK